jgi:hypothetical protein
VLRLKASAFPNEQDASWINQGYCVRCRDRCESSRLVTDCVASALHCLPRPEWSRNGVLTRVLSTRHSSNPFECSDTCDFRSFAQQSSQPPGSKKQHSQATSIRHNKAARVHTRTGFIQPLHILPIRLDTTLYIANMLTTTKQPLRQTVFRYAGVVQGLVALPCMIQLFCSSWLYFSHPYDIWYWFT